MCFRLWSFGTPTWRAYLVFHHEYEEQVEEYSIHCKYLVSHCMCILVLVYMYFRGNRKHIIQKFCIVDDH